MLTGLFCLLFVPVIEAAELDLKPYFKIVEEYTDNVYDSNSIKKADFITRTMPGFDLLCKSQLLDMNLKYNLDYRYYAMDSKSQELTHNLDAKSLARFVENTVFLEVVDAYKKVSLDKTRDYTLESLTVNQSDQNIITISPYLTLRPMQRFATKTGYNFRDVWYKDASADAKTDHTVYFDNEIDLTEKVNLRGGYSYTNSEGKISTQSRHTPYVGIRYEYFEKSFLIADAGYTWMRINDNKSISHPYWTVGIEHDFGLVKAKAEAGVKYTDDPKGVTNRETFYSFNINKLFHKAKAGLSVSYKQNYVVETNYVNSADAQAGANINYELSPKLNLTTDALYDWIDIRFNNTYTRRILFNTVLDYNVIANCILSFGYHLVDLFSPGIAVDNYMTNRVSLELRYTF